MPESALPKPPVAEYMLLTAPPLGESSQPCLWTVISVRQTKAATKVKLGECRDYGVLEVTATFKDHVLPDGWAIVRSADVLDALTLRAEGGRG